MKKLTLWIILILFTTALSACFGSSQPITSPATFTATPEPFYNGVEVVTATYDEAVNFCSDPSTSGKIYSVSGKLYFCAVITWYNPALLGSSCAQESNGECISLMANGEPWQDHMDDNTIAAPPFVEFGSVITIKNESFTVRDRSGHIRNPYTISMLRDEAHELEQQTVLVAFSPPNDGK